MPKRDDKRTDARARIFAGVVYAGALGFAAWTFFADGLVWFRLVATLVAVVAGVVLGLLFPWFPFTW